MSTKPSTSRTVKPRALSWKHHLGAELILFYLRLIMSTVRLHAVHPPSLTRLPTDQPLIFCIWHNRLSLCLLLYRDYVRRSGRPDRMAGMVSASRDGGMLAKVLTRLGIHPVRGSSSRRGAQALLEMTNWGKQGYDLAVTPDGPRGPCYHIQPGIISLAQLTGQPIIPVSYSVRGKVRLKSWDRFILPLPFARCSLKVGEPLWVSRQADDAERENLRMELEKRMRDATVD